jgi:CheY-like chemotaxis protein
VRAHSRLNNERGPQETGDYSSKGLTHQVSPLSLSGAPHLRRGYQTLACHITDQRCIPDITDPQDLLEGACNGGRLLLILISSDVQSAAQLAQASQLTPVQTLRQLEHLVDQGLIIADDEARIASISSRRWARGRKRWTACRRVLVVEDDLALRQLFVEMLDQEGYAVIGAGTLIEATTLLTHISFDPAITDAFSQSPQAC